MKTLCRPKVEEGSPIEERVEELKVTRTGPGVFRIEGATISEFPADVDVDFTGFGAQHG